MVGDGFKMLVDGIGEGTGFVIETVGGVVQNTIGKAVEETSDILGGVTDFVKGPIMDFFIIVASIAVVAFLFYLFIRHGLMRRDSGHAPLHHSIQAPPYTQVTTVRKRHFQNEECVDF